MNEHIKKGNDALAIGDLQTAIAEFKLAKKDTNIVTRRTAESRLHEINKSKIFEKEVKKNQEIQTNKDSSTFGYLSDWDYHVGNKGVPKKERHHKLRDAFYDQIILREERWGKSGSPERFEKLVSALTFRVNSNYSRPEMSDAVKDWSDDLNWLETDFKKEVFDKKK